MSKNTIPQKTMLRIRACAMLFLDSSRKVKIEEIADAKGTDIIETSVMYTIGAIKRAIKQGRARNYSDALEQLESEQAGDRGNRLLRTLSADALSSDIARINNTNAGYTVSLDGTSYTHEYDTAIAIDGVQYTIPNYTTSEAPEKANKPGNSSIGKVFGTLYTEWEARSTRQDPVNEIYNRQIIKNLQVFFNEYESRLSKTSKKRLYELAQSGINARFLMSKEGQKSPDTGRFAWNAYRLYEAFPHKDAISGIEYIDLVRQFINPSVS